MGTKSKSIWKESLALTLPALKRAWGWLLLFIAIEEAISAVITVYGAKILPDERFVVVTIIFAVAFQLFLSAISVVVINQILFDVRNKRSIPVLSSLNQNLKYVFIESTRAFLPIILRGLLLIVPGVVEAIRLYFVPYIAQFDDEYKSGRVDALQKSRDLVQGRFWYVTGLLILAFIVSMVPRFWLESIDLGKRPAYYGFAFLISLLAELYSDVVLFVTYERLVEAPLGPQISLPRDPESRESSHL